jgi:hypothetical protein
VTTRYFKRRWDETRGEDHDTWGRGTWFFEVGSDGNIVRQLEVYDDGPMLRYGPDHKEDEYGGLGQGNLEALEDWSPRGISSTDFEEAWSPQP